VEKSKKISEDEIKRTIDQIYREMEETLKGMEDVGMDDQLPEMNGGDDVKVDLSNENGQQVPPDELLGSEEAQNGMSLDIVALDGKATANLDAEPSHEEEVIVAGMDKTMDVPQPVDPSTESLDVPDTDPIIDAPDIDYRADEEIIELVQDIKREIGRVVIGYDDVIENLLMAILVNGHVLLEGVPGIAKTTLAKTFTSILGMKWQRIQFTPDMLPQDITGHYFYNQKTNDFELRKGPIFSNLLLADEINRTTPKTQSALLEAMEEKQVTIEGSTFTLPRPFMVIATINPIEHDGVYQLPIAQADRFMFKLNMGYITNEKELEFLKMKANGKGKEEVSLKLFNVEKLREAYNEVYVDDAIVDYINNIISCTRNTELVTIGASPRAAEHLMYAAKARACIHGRDYTIPDDVKGVVYEILNHRLVLSPEIDPDEHSIGNVINDILEDVKVPLEKR